MNRTIKFRGKRIDNGQWVYGFLADSYYINDVNSVDLSSIEIDPETVGQFTGLLDRNGNEIYEGDIMQVNYIMATGRHFIGLSYEVRWCIQDGSWTAWNGCSDFALPKPRQILIKGNIHDNPELLNSKQ
jgi:uncharacterized phage protein (TIGR01671 family)